MNVNQSREVYLNYYSSKCLQVKTASSQEMHKDQKVLEVDVTKPNLMAHLHEPNSGTKARRKHYCIMRQRKKRYEQQQDKHKKSSHDIRYVRSIKNVTRRPGKLTAFS